MTRCAPGLAGVVEIEHVAQPHSATPGDCRTSRVTLVPATRQSVADGPHACACCVHVLLPQAPPGPDGSRKKAGVAAKKFKNW